MFNSQKPGKMELCDRSRPDEEWFIGAVSIWKPTVSLSQEPGKSLKNVALSKRGRRNERLWEQDLPSEKRPPTFGLTRKSRWSISAPTTPPWRSGLLPTPSSTPMYADRSTQTQKRTAWSLTLRKTASLSAWPLHTARNAGEPPVKRQKLPQATL